jgi:hypothetical protein
MIANAGGSPIYWAYTESVSSTNKEGELLAGESLTLSRGTFIVSASTTQVFLANLRESLGEDLASQEELEDRTLISVKSYGAKGDGSTDDIAALKRANTAAAAKGVSLYFPDGTYMIGSEWIPSVSLSFAPEAVLKKTASFSATRAVKVEADGIRVEGLKLNGNRSAGATGAGLWWEGKEGLARNCETNHTKGLGLGVANGGELTLEDCRSFDNVFGTGVTDDEASGGFYCQSGGTLRAIRCAAEENGSYGFHFEHGASAACHLDGRSRRNFTGAIVRSVGGTGESFVSVEDSKFGVIFGSEATKVGQELWSFESVASSKNGVAFKTSAGAEVAQNQAGTGVQMYAADSNTIGQIIVKQALGYGLALTRETATSVGCVGNKIGVVCSDQGGAADGDPGIHFSGACKQNQIGVAVIRKHTFAVSFGEGIPGTPEYNTIGSLVSDFCPYGIWKVTTGAHNRIRTIVDVDSYNVEEALATALLYFKGAAVKDNRVDSFKHQVASNPEAALQAQVTEATENGFAAAITEPEATSASLKTAVNSIRAVLKEVGLTE